MATALVRTSAAAVTDRGRKRSSNEDAFGYSIEHGVYLVCDGMGGAAAGEIASSLAIDEVLRLVTERVTEARQSADVVGGGGNESGQSSGRGGEDSKPGAALVAAIAEEAVVAANHAIHSRAQRNARLSGMGTTLVGLLASIEDGDSRMWILNVGDSRCYRLRGESIELCTQDHSLVEEQVRMGRMTRSEASRSPLRNVITRALGTQPSVTPDVIEVEVEAGDLFLLCSDGLTRELSDEKIASILREPNAEEEATGEGAELDRMCLRLIAAANRAGGHDNITCLIVRVA